MDPLKFVMSSILTLYNKGLLPQLLGEVIGKSGVVIVLIGDDGVAMRSANDLNLPKNNKNARLYASVMKLLEDHMDTLISEAEAPNENP